MRKSRGAHGVAKLARCVVLLVTSLLAAPREAVAVVGHYAAGALNARDLFVPPAGWADVLAEMDHNVGQMLDAVDQLGIRDDTIVIVASDNGPEFVRPWDGWAGPWRGQYFTAWEGGIRVPFMIRWPGRVPAGRVSDEIVHGVGPVPDARGCRRRQRAEGPPDRRREPVRFPPGQGRQIGARQHSIWCADRLQAVKWRNYKVHFYQQDTMVSPALKLGVPMLFNLYTNPREDEAKPAVESWVVGPVLQVVAAFEESVKRHPLIPMGTPDPYTPPK